MVVLTLFLLWLGPPANAQLFGDGSDGDTVISDSTVFAPDTEYNFRNLTINPGATLDPLTSTIRVSGIFVNNGSIIGKGHGGLGGLGGGSALGGRSHLPPEPSNPGQPGEPPLYEGGGAGGAGGASGGGGGGAWWPDFSFAANGGWGGSGGHGGPGGGVVVIYARQFENNGLIDVSGNDGAPGSPGLDGNRIHNHDVVLEILNFDMSGGGGSGGQGGQGGQGGTVKIHYHTLISAGTGLA